MKTHINIASVQMFVAKEQKENMKTMEEYLKHIYSVFPHIDMVVFPELCAMDFNSDFKKTAQSSKGQLVETFSGWAKKYKLWLIPGSFYEKSGESIYNSCPVFSPEGLLIGIYRKRYPWFPYEKTTPGNKPFVFEIPNVGKVGIMICYDSWFPEVSRDLINLGAEMIIVPTMTTTGDRRQEQIVSQATAIMQQSYVVSCNAVGYGGNGGSQIIDPEGCLLQNNNEGACLQTAIIDFERVRIVREIGTAGVSTPLKTFNSNKQVFKVYN